VRRLASVCLLIALAGASPGQAHAQERIAGGADVALGQAPWAAFMTSATPQGTSTCSGSVVDALHVLTAAHCTYLADGTPQPPANLHVAAGFTQGTQTTPAPQIRAVGAVARHPYYAGGIAPSGAAFIDALAEADIAVMTLTTPFDLSGPYTRAIPVAGRKAKVFGKPLQTFGWGEIADGVDTDRLRSVDLRAIPSGACLDGVPATLCLSMPTGDTCHGDSGAGTVRTGRAPVLVGVHSASDSGCSPGGASVDIDVRSREIAVWLRTGTQRPPRGPRLQRPARIAGNGPHALRCRAARWTGRPKHRFRFFYAASGKTVRKGAATYRLRRRDRGHLIKCSDTAKNKGGSAESISRNSQRIIKG
jgi:hypothetical protein